MWYFVINQKNEFENNEKLNLSKKPNQSTYSVNPSSPYQNCIRCGGNRNSTVVKHPRLNLVMGQGKILKRSEKLSPDYVTKREECYDLVLGSTNRLGLVPQMVKKQFRVQNLTRGLYTRPISVASSLSSSVPIPGFLGRITGAVTGDL